MIDPRTQSETIAPRRDMPMQVMQENPAAKLDAKAIKAA